MQKKQYGNFGEDIAERYVTALGYTVLERNFATKAGELDLICLDGGTLVFIEVKRRFSGAYGTPAEAVTERKQYKISLTAVSYTAQKKAYNVPKRFDIIEIYGNDVRHIRNAFLSKVAF